MNNKLKQFGETITFKWQGMNKRKKMMLFLSLISILVVGASSYYMFNRIEYGVLFSDLSEQDAGNITKDLQKQTIEYKLENNGRTILVPKEKVDAYRINLAVDNKLPNSSKGLELFDNTNFMTTDEDRKIMYQRAVTGELQRAIESLQSVSKAKVLLVMPDNSVFSDKNKASTASVVLTLKTATISDTAVQGIVNLVSGAVENLTPENVKVVDSNGRTLTTVKNENGQVSNQSDRYIEIKRNYEKSFEEKLDSLLNRVYGENSYQLSVNLDLNFDSIESTKVTYGNTAIRSENVQVSGNQGDVQRAQNGTIEENVTNVTGDANREGSKNYERSVNNEVGSETVKTVNAPSAIKRMTSSIVVNKKLSGEEQENLQKIVESAIGFNAGRGDVLSIEGIDFSKSAKNQANMEQAEEAKNGKALKRYSLYFAIGLAILFIIFLMIFLFIRRRRRNNAYDEYEEYDDGDDSDGISLLNKEITLKETTQQEMKGKTINEKKETEGDKIREFADKNPEIAAELIKAWMKENS